MVDEAREVCWAKFWNGWGGVGEDVIWFVGVWGGVFGFLFCFFFKNWVSCTFQEFTIRHFLKIHSMWVILKRSRLNRSPLHQQIILRHYLRRLHHHLWHKVQMRTFLYLIPRQHWTSNILDTMNHLLQTGLHNPPAPHFQGRPPEIGHRVKGRLGLGVPQGAGAKGAGFGFIWAFHF